MFVLQKTKRADNRAILHVTGRDVEDMQINLEFDRERKIWDFVSFESSGENPAEKLIAALVALLTERITLSRTATEIVEELKTVDDSLTVTPNVFSRILKENIIELENLHKIKVSFNRTNRERTIDITMGDGDDSFLPTPA
jgi:hypothetical protein